MTAPVPGPPRTAESAAAETTARLRTEAAAFAALAPDDLAGTLAAGTALADSLSDALDQDAGEAGRGRA